MAAHCGGGDDRTDVPPPRANRRHASHARKKEFRSLHWLIPIRSKGVAIVFPFVDSCLISRSIFQWGVGWGAGWTRLLQKMGRYGFSMTLVDGRCEKVGGRS
jgi:hypothetical protein